MAIVFVVCVTHLALSPNNMSKLYETTAVSESKHSLRAVGVQEISSPVPKVGGYLRPNMCMRAWYDIRPLVNDSKT